MPGESSRSPFDASGARLVRRTAAPSERRHDHEPDGDDMTNVHDHDVMIDEASSPEDPQGPGKRFARLFGALFLAGFLVYGIGYGLVSSVISAPDFLSTLAGNSTVLLVGAFLMLLNTGVD